MGKSIRTCLENNDRQLHHQKHILFSQTDNILGTVCMLLNENSFILQLSHNLFSIGSCWKHVIRQFFFLFQVNFSTETEEICLSVTSGDVYLKKIYNLKTANCLLLINKISEIKEIYPYKANLRLNENFYRLIKKEK